MRSGGKAIVGRETEAGKRLLWPGSRMEVKRRARLEFLARLAS